MPYAKEWLSSCSRMATACSLPPAALWSPPSGVCQENSSNKTLLHAFSMSCHRSSVWFLKLQVSQDKSSLFSQKCNPGCCLSSPWATPCCPLPQGADWGSISSLSLTFTFYSLLSECLPFAVLPFLDSSTAIQRMGDQSHADKMVDWTASLRRLMTH